MEQTWGEEIRQEERMRMRRQEDEDEETRG